MITKKRKPLGFLFIFLVKSFFAITLVSSIKNFLNSQILQSLSTSCTRSRHSFLPGFSFSIYIDFNFTEVNIQVSNFRNQFHLSVHLARIIMISIYIIAINIVSLLQRMCFILIAALRDYCSPKNCNCTNLCAGSAIIIRLFRALFRGLEKFCFHDLAACSSHQLRMRSLM